MVLCDDAHITTLNATHRGKATPTDVLSFELEDDLDFKVGHTAYFFVCASLFYDLPSPPDKAVCAGKIACLG